jgi:hypothetical protein
MNARLLGVIVSAALVGTVLVAAIPAQAHGDPVHPYDPLSPHLTYFFTNNKNMTPLNPVSNETVFNVPQGSGTPPGPSPPQMWSVAMAHKVTLSGPIEVHLWVQAGTQAPVAPLLTEPSNPVTAWLLVNGQKVGKNVSSPDVTPAIESGAPVDLNFTFPAPDLTVLQGGQVQFAFAFNWPVANAGGSSTVQYLFGPKHLSGWTEEVTMASLEDMGVVHDPTALFGVNWSKAPSVGLGHAGVDLFQEAESGFIITYANATVGQTVEIRLLSQADKDWATQYEDGTGGLMNPIVVTVTKGSQTLVKENLYPGEWVIRTFVPTATGSYSLTCASGCSSLTYAGLLNVTNPAPVTNGSTGNPGGSGGQNPGSGGSPGTGTTGNQGGNSGGGGLFGIPSISVPATLLGVGLVAFAARSRFGRAKR